TCFNTHMHELAEHCESLSGTDAAAGKAVSIVMENDEAHKYKISRRKPDGKSYAHAIAQKYGITFKQLRENL
ncbi:MAG: DNA mismatch repair protein, partial [Oscillospiraceae bacterium]|nr:DNA mismatch repair protein [Oscillospiraceae bacterium]